MRTKTTFSTIIIVAALTGLFSYGYSRIGRNGPEVKCEGEEKQIVSCWDKAIANVLKKKGLELAFSQFSQLYDQEPLFQKNCHDFTHRLGRGAYELFSEGKFFRVSPKTQYCSFGFYHGFMETLVAKSQDFKKAREFCAYVDQQLREESPNASGACFHGIGHGWASIHEKISPGDEKKIVEPALNLCEKVSETDDQIFRCATGVFDSIAIAYYNKLYGLEMKKENPLWLCQEQPDYYKLPCYRELMTAVIRLADNDLKQAIPYVSKFVETPYRAISVRVLADASVRFLEKKTGPEESIAICHSLEDLSRQSCIRGLSDGVIQHGPPGEEYKGAIAFCKSSLLSSEEKDLCFRAAIGYFSQIYSPAKFKKTCDMVEKEYKKLCR